MGASAYVTKPFSPDDLLSTVRQLLPGEKEVSNSDPQAGLFAVLEAGEDPLTSPEA
jgi:DNA-binding response OmpR family regulator